MNHELLLPVAMGVGVAWGVILGVLYFGGLWLTVRRLPTTLHPVQFSIISLLMRFGLCLMGFFLMLEMSRSAPLPLLSCVAAFIWTRNRMVQRLAIKVE